MPKVYEQKQLYREKSKTNSKTCVTCGCHKTLNHFPTDGEEWWQRKDYCHDCNPKAGRKRAKRQRRRAKNKADKKKAAENKKKLMGLNRPTYQGKFPTLP